MKKILVILCSLAVLGTVLTGCAMNKNETTSTTSDQTLTPTSSMSEKASEALTDISEDVSEAMTDASENMADDTTTTMPDTTK